MLDYFNKKQDNIDLFMKTISSLDDEVIIDGSEAMKYIFQLQKEN